MEFSQLTDSQLVANILCMSNHVVIQRTSPLHNQKMMLLLNHSFTLVSFRQVSTGVDVGVVPLTGPTVVCHRDSADNKRQKGFPCLPETGFAHDAVT